MNGSKFLKITGILMIIGGIICLIAGIAGLVGSAVLSVFGAKMGLLYVGSVLCLIDGIIELIAGVKGAKHCNDPVQGAKCLPWGVIVAILAILGQIITVAAGGNFKVVNLIFGLIIPILYIVGAVKIKGEIPKA